MNKNYRTFILIILIGLSGIYHQSLLAKQITDSIDLQGFITQGAIYTSANNYHGDSEHQWSFDQTELGLNLSWQISENIDFTALGLYHKAGQVDNGSLQLDYGMFNINLYKDSKARMGTRLGRIKNPIGLFNETRNISFSTPTILLPQSIYLERSRSLYISSDGIQIYADTQLGQGWLTLKANYGLARNDNKEIQQLMFNNTVPGKLEVNNPVFAGQILYKLYNDKWIFALSYADVKFKYKSGLNDYLSPGSAQFSPVIFSTQYNHGLFSFTGEYYYSANKFKNFGPFYPDYNPETTNWYLQSSYQLADNWQVTVRYDQSYLDKENRSGSKFTQVGLPHHLGFAKDWTLALRYDVTPSLMLRAEWHKIKGTSWISTADNPDRSLTRQDWNLYAIQLSYHFK